MQSKIICPVVHSVRVLSNQQQPVHLKAIPLSGGQNTKHCINVFGEDLFAEHAEKAISVACRETGAILRDFTAAPYFYDRSKKGYHEWLIEFVRSPQNKDS